MNKKAKALEEFSPKMDYWSKIRSLYKDERVICDQVRKGEVPEEDRYLLARACVRNGFKEAYALLSVLPEVNIIVEAEVCDPKLFDQLIKSDSYYEAMTDYKEVSFSPIKVDKWYNLGQTYVNNHYDYKWNVKPEWQLLKLLQRRKPVNNYDVIRQALNKQLPRFIWLEEEIAPWIKYICYHAMIDECKIWLTYNIFNYRSYIQHGIMKSLSFAKYCYNRQDMVCDDAIRRSMLNMLIMNDIIPECDHTMPYCIWYPKVPQELTLRELVAKVPKLAILAGRVCAIAHYNELYDSLNIPADEATYQEAIVSGNEYLVKKLMSIIMKITQELMKRQDMFLLCISLSMKTHKHAILYHHCNQV
jgi:hypothetical protein